MDVKLKQFEAISQGNSFKDACTLSDFLQLRDSAKDSEVSLWTISRGHGTFGFTCNFLEKGATLNASNV